MRHRPSPCVGATAPLNGPSGDGNRSLTSFVGKDCNAEKVFSSPRERKRAATPAALMTRGRRSIALQIPVRAGQLSAQPPLRGPMAKKPTATYSAPALEKGLDIVELLSREEVGLSQSEIARALGRSVGEIFRMLMVLQNRGYVAQDPVSDRYRLTTYLFEIAHRIPSIGRLTAAAEPAMRALSVQVNQSTHLAILSDASVLVIGQMNSPGNNILTVRLGAKIDLWQASSGRVMLAFRPEGELAQLLDTVPLPRGTTPERIRADLAQIRTAGVETRDSFLVKGVVNISAPVIDHSGLAAAALTIPHIERYGDPVTFEDCRTALVDTAAAITRTLGGQPPIPD
ncbi:IclR family transcriptional regulator [Rhodobacteraceae bacterium CCMM004]|nr:IclR family transcriptional regulator [Rhodobacteraceae bacterium CCMM004]